jgi:GNAT superfamily N-acetyltransferase
MSRRVDPTCREPGCSLRATLTPLTEPSVDRREGAALVDGALRTAFLALFQLIESARIEQRSGYWLLASPRTPFAQFCGVWAEHTPEQDEACAAALETSLDEIESAGMPFTLQVRDGLAPLTERRGTELGLTAVEPIEGMLLLPSGLIRPPGADDLTIRPIGVEELEQALDVTARGFEAPPDALRSAYTPTIFTFPGFICYLGFLGDRAVTAGVCAHVEDIAGIFSVATPTEHRRRGYASRLVFQAAQDAFEAGAKLAYLQASPIGCSVYQRLGFRTVEHYRILSRPPAD